jgi:hypothetical protein
MVSLDSAVKDRVKLKIAAMCVPSCSPVIVLGF